MTTFQQLNATLHSTVCRAPPQGAWLRAHTCWSGKTGQWPRIINEVGNKSSPPFSCLAASWPRSSIIDGGMEIKTAPTRPKSFAYTYMRVDPIKISLLDTEKKERQGQKLTKKLSFPIKQYCPLRYWAAQGAAHVFNDKFLVRKALHACLLTWIERHWRI